MTENVGTGTERDSVLIRFRRRKARNVATMLVGEMTIVFADIEFDVTRSLRSLTGTPLAEKRAAMDKRIFKRKLEALRQTVQRLQENSNACAVEFIPLHRSVARLRKRRNVFVHGRWDPETASFLLGNPSYNVLSKQMETTCPLPVLRKELLQLRSLAAELRAWRERWGL
jgi:hypothetical protein